MNPICIKGKHPVSGRYYRDFWGNTLCAAHFKRTVSCSYCGRFITESTTGGGKALKDGRAICGLCFKKAVSLPAEGKKILMDTYRKLEGLGITIDPFKPEFALIDRKDLKRLDSTGREKQGAAVFKRVLKGNTIESFELQVFILKDLPLVSCISTCAHELMHIWFYSRGITEASPGLTEGSCNLASYLILQQRKEPEAAYLIQNFFADPHKVYGRGFRKMHRIFDAEGISGWLNYISLRKR